MMASRSWITAAVLAVTVLTAADYRRLHGHALVYQPRSRYGSDQGLQVVEVSCLYHHLVLVKAGGTTEHSGASPILREGLQTLKSVHRQRY